MKYAVAFVAMLCVVAFAIIALFSFTGPGDQLQGVARQLPDLGPRWFGVAAFLTAVGLLATLVLLAGEAVRKRANFSSAGPVKRSDHTFLILFLMLLATAAVFTVLLASALALIPSEDLENASVLGGEDMDGEPDELSGEVGGEPPDVVAVEAVEAERGASSRGLLIALGIAAAVVAGFLAYRYIKSIRASKVVEDEESFQELREELARSALLSLERILAEPDHRIAIIAAYAHMEATLADHGFPREESQTPIEYMKTTLDRIESALSRRPTRAALPRRQLLTLTKLYEVAKFSLHEMSASDRDAALKSLREVEESAPARPQARELR